MHEAQMHPKNSFLTLTYDQDHLPLNRSLDVSHWQCFAKRLRKSHGPFRFLHCGEYGDENLRPHYHALIFGHDFGEDSAPLHRNDGSDFPLRVSESLTKLWPHGFHTIGTVTFDSAAYVASYTTKRKTGAAAVTAAQRVDPTTGECWDVEPEYATMSRRPGLGATWFEKYCGDIYPDNFVVMNGQKLKPPAYYDKLLERQNPTLHNKMKQKRRAQIRLHLEDLTPERLDVREKVCEAQLAK